MNIKWALLLLLLLNHTAISAVAAAHSASESFEQLTVSHPLMAHDHHDHHGEHHQNHAEHSEHNLADNYFDHHDDEHHHSLHIHPSSGDCHFASLSYSAIKATNSNLFISSPSLYTNLRDAPPVPPPNS